MAGEGVIITLLLFFITGGQSEVTFNYDNQCLDTVWLAASPSIGDADPERDPGTLEIFFTPDEWTGSIWARTKCTNNASFYFSCETGDCGSGTIECQSPPPTYPVTLLNFSINQSVVSYEVSLNHGHNIGVRIQPIGGSLVDGTGPCPVVDCVADLSNVCPANLVATNKDGLYVGCYSACDALKDPKYCCTGDYSSPQTCQPNEYSTRFKNLCNLAHTYPGDNQPPIYNCRGAEKYYITFCPK
uniref:Thaumatin-like protein n=1 Tax=Fagus sylvatica TaxID=28930 RepID=A0A2N9GPK8_FAGSY